MAAAATPTTGMKCDESGTFLVIIFTMIFPTDKSYFSTKDMRDPSFVYEYTATFGDFAGMTVLGGFAKIIEGIERMVCTRQISSPNNLIEKIR